MQSYFILLLLPFLTFPKVYTTEYTVLKVRSVYDGDTFRADLNCKQNILCENMSVRLRGIDTPEKKGKCPKEKKLALQARDSLRAWLSNAKEIKLTNIGRGKYFRLVASVIVDGQNVSDKLIKLNLAKAYDGGKKSPWCD